MIVALIAAALIWGALSPDRVASPLRAAAAAGARGAGQHGRQAAATRWAAGATGRAARRKARSKSWPGRAVNAAGSGLAGLGRILGGTSTTVGGAAAGAVTAARSEWGDARAEHDRRRAAAGGTRTGAAARLIHDTFRRAAAEGSVRQRLQALLGGLTTTTTTTQPQNPVAGQEASDPVAEDQTQPSGEPHAPPREPGAPQDRAPGEPGTQPDTAVQPDAGPDPAAAGEQQAPPQPLVKAGRTPQEEADYQRRLARLGALLGAFNREQDERKAAAGAQASPDSLPAGKGSTTSDSEQENTPMPTNPTATLDVADATALQAIAKQFAAAAEAAGTLQAIAMTAAGLPDALTYGPGFKVLNVIMALAELAPDAKQLGEFAEMLPELDKVLGAQLNRNEHIASDGLTGEAAAHVTT